MEYRTALRQKPALVVKMKNPATKKVPRSFLDALASLDSKLSVSE